MQPQSLEGARLAGVRAAQQAWKVYRSVMQGAEGVEARVFQQALPRLEVRQLVDCSKHFGQRGNAVGPLAAELAGEVSRRLQSKELAPVAEGAANAASSARSMNSQEVTAVTYNFSKLPQLPEYAVLYNAVADGLIDGAWQLNRLQSVLIGTALADVDLRLVDALPVVLRPVLAELASEEARNSIAFDELRFLVHASVRLPNIAVQDIETLADCTKRLLVTSKGNFAARAHLAVAWLRLTPPAGSKEVHLETLRSCCVALMDFERSFLPAHPLPREGLAPAVSSLLAREEEQTAPPLTPPAMGEIIKGLAQISWGLERNKMSAPKNRSLGIDDWAEIMQKTVGFCEAHSTSFVVEHSQVNRPLTLPVWAAEVLYHVLWRAQKLKPASDSGTDLVEFESLLKLLRMVRRHRTKPAPDAEFYSWAAQLVVAHHEAGTASRGQLAEAVRELVPHLQRQDSSSMAQLSHELAGISKALSSASSPGMFVSEDAARQKGPRLFVGSERASSSVHLAASARRLPSEVKLEAEPMRSVTSAPSVALAARASAGGRLWGMLAAHGTTAPRTESVRVQAPVPKAELAERKPVSATDAMQKAEETQQLLAKALERVEALEAKLKEQEERREAKMTTRTYSTSARERRTHKADESPKSLQDSLEESSGWLAGFLPSPVDTIQPSPAAATLHLQRGFKFEDYRKSQSPRLQMERLRVLVPPDHFPMWPLPKK